MVLSGKKGTVDISDVQLSLYKCIQVLLIMYLFVLLLGMFIVPDLEPAKGYSSPA